MCGICGEVTFDGTRASRAAVEAMADAMAARGPDAEGLLAHGPMAFGHRRLKIIDLSEQSQQPMADPELGLEIVFNGCIYNYRELRDELKAKGYRFFSDGDTEVILKAWHAWGAGAVRRFNGMFAFALRERQTGRLVLGRDRLGIKPLYYTVRAAGVRFASSLPALLAGGGISAEIDPIALHYYMTFHAVVPAPHTILAEVRKLPPATLMVVEPDGRKTETRYWDLSFNRTAEDETRPREEWRAMVLDGLRKAVRRRLVADVPVGVLLSGGLDSSLITGLVAEAGVQDLSTFSVGFEAVDGEEGDEFRYSDIVAEAFATRHHRIFVESRRLLDALPHCIAAMSEPMVSHDAVGFYLLSQEVSRHLTVVQSGQGADEVFAGYHWYPPLRRSNDPEGDYVAGFFDRDHAEFTRAVAGRHTGADHSRAFVSRHFSAPGADAPVDKALRLDTTIMLVDDPVKRVDNMTMAWGLEARVPFLDHELVELAARIPAEHKLSGGGKGILKEAAREVIPAGVIDRPKGYFPVPALKYLEGPALDFVLDVLNQPAARSRELFRSDYVAELLSDPKGHITPLRGSKLWQIAVLEAWLQTNAL